MSSITSLDAEIRAFLDNNLKGPTGAPISGIYETLKEYNENSPGDPECAVIELGEFVLSDENSDFTTGTADLYVTFTAKDTETYTARQLLYSMVDRFRDLLRDHRNLGSGSIQYTENTGISPIYEGTEDSTLVVTSQIQFGF